MLHTLRFFSLKCSFFHNSNLFGSCIIHILYTVCAKIKKNNSGAKRLSTALFLTARDTELYAVIRYSTLPCSTKPEYISPVIHCHTHSAAYELRSERQS